MTPTLSSVYHPSPETGVLDLTLELGDMTFEPGMLLGLNSGTAVRPTDSSGVAKHEALSTRITLRPEHPEAIAGTNTWVIPGLRPIVPIVHHNQGPDTAWLHLPDGSVVDVDVAPTERADLDDAEPAPASDVSATSTPEHDLPLLPRPAHVEVDGPNRHGLGIRSTDDRTGQWPAVERLAHRLGVEINEGDDHLDLSAAIDADLSPTAYALEVDGLSATMRAGSESAARHALITLAQLCAVGVPERIRVADEPHLAHRGLSMDLARRWFEPDVVDRLIDLAAWRKLTHLQLHLTDDEAWRVPIAGLPELAEVGGTRGIGLPIGPLCGSGAAPYGRAYTVEEIDRWVRRAHELGVELVPEIDIPGHCHAALVALPHLRDPDDRSRSRSVQGFPDNALVPGDVTTRFLHTVFGEVADLFAHSRVLHVGGDEVAHGAWAGSPRAAEFARRRGLTAGPHLQRFPIADAAAAIVAAGREWAGWEEVAQYDYDHPPAHVVAWTSLAASTRVLERGYPVVAAPAEAVYLDMAHDDHWRSPGASWAGSISLGTTCDVDLASAFEPDHLHQLVGLQAAMWAEHVSSVELLDHLLFPRLDAVAERGWSGDTRGRADDIARRAAELPTLRRDATGGRS